MMWNVRLLLLRNSPVLVPLPISGTEAGTAGLAAVVNDTTPSAPPARVGANFAVARSTSPLCRVTGNRTPSGVPLPRRVRVTRPSVNGSGVLSASAEAPLGFPAPAAGPVPRLLEAAPGGVPRTCAAPLVVSAAAPVRPKPSTWPSLVPTYTMPLSVATTQNLADVPIGAAQISRSFAPPPDRGTGSRPQAPRYAPAPVPSR